MRWANDLTLDSANDLVAAAYDLPPRIFKAYILLGAHCRRRGFLINASRRVADAVMLSPRFWAEKAAPRLEEHGFEERDGCLFHPEVEGVKANPRSEINRRNAAQRWARERERQARLFDPPSDAAGEPPPGAGGMQSDAIAPNSHDAIASGLHNAIASGLHSENHAKSTSGPDANAAFASASHANSHANAHAHALSLSESSPSESLEILSPSEREGGGLGGNGADANHATGLQIASGLHADRSPPAGAGRPKYHPLPDDWAPPPRAEALAREIGVDLAYVARKFRTQAKEHGKRNRDWDAAFMTFLAREQPVTNQAHAPLVIQGGRQAAAGAPAAAPEPPPEAADGPEPEAQWSRVRRALHGEIGATEFRTWASQARLVGLDGGEVTIALPSRFLRDWFQQRLADHVARLWRTQNSTIRRVIAVVAEPAARTA